MKTGSETRTSTRRIVLLGLASYLVTISVTAPAALLDQVVRHVTNGRLTLANSHGTIWRGGATPLLHIDQNAVLPLQALNWQFQPDSLLRGQLKFGIRWDALESFAPMEIMLTADSFTLSNLQLPLPARVLGELSPFLKPAQFGGDLRIESKQLTFSGNQLQGNAIAHWNQAGSALSTVQPLGDYQIDIAAAQNGVSATLSTKSGALLLDGSGTWSAGQKTHFNGTARAAEASREALAELLHHLGPEESPGVIWISI